MAAKMMANTISTRRTSRIPMPRAPRLGRDRPRLALMFSGWSSKHIAATGGGMTGGLEHLDRGPLLGPVLCVRQDREGHHQLPDVDCTLDHILIRVWFGRFIGERVKVPNRVGATQLFNVQLRLNRRAQQLP